jgi:hypothetical protein
MLSKKIRDICTEIVTLHSKMGGAFFYSPPSTASARRSYEKNHSLDYDFAVDGKKYSVDIVTSCSCKNVYYNCTITVDGVKKNITAIKKLLKDEVVK